jgi:hypothetical protein
VSEVVHDRLVSEVVHGRLVSEVVHGRLVSEVVHDRLVSEVVHDNNFSGEKKRMVTGPRWWPDTRTDWPAISQL